MHTIKIKAEFSSAHNLRGYKGKCEDLHGHNWKVEIAVCKNELDNIGMVQDFRLLKKELDKVLEELDHKYLNDLAFFKKVNPTSENIAKYIYDKLKHNLPGLCEVTIWESDNASASYCESEGECCC